MFPSHLDFAFSFSIGDSSGLLILIGPLLICGPSIGTIDLILMINVIFAYDFTSVLCVILGDW